jgi:hypothetical protein
MKHKLLVLLLVLGFAPIVRVACQTQASTDDLSYRASEITVSESLLRFSEQMGFKYMDVLKKAEAADILSIKSLLEFHGTTDGKDALNHAVTCIELLPVAGDENYAYAAKNVKPKLKKLLLERFAIAQGRTQKTGLQKPMKDWAPMTWAALNDLPIPGACDISTEYEKSEDGTMKLKGPKKPGQEETKPAQKLLANPDATPDRGGRQ